MKAYVSRNLHCILIVLYTGTCIESFTYTLYKSTISLLLIVRQGNKMISVLGIPGYDS